MVLEQAAWEIVVTTLARPASMIDSEASKRRQIAALAAMVDHHIRALQPLWSLISRALTGASHRIQHAVGGL